MRINKFIYTLIYYTLTVNSLNLSDQLYKLSPKPENNSRSFESYTSCFEKLGCVSTTEEWFHHSYRPKNLEPLDRHTIKTEINLVTIDRTSNKTLKFDFVNVKNGSDLVKQCAKSQMLIFLIHDFTSNGYTGWVKHTASVLLTKKNSTVLSVDWQAGAEPPFEQAISNARVVALEILAFLKSLQDNVVSLNSKTTHLIGHGVGAHIAGYVGHSHPVNKITGLDPTGPYFEHMPTVVRLDPTDAKLVEVLHTDAYTGRSQGAQTSMGHLDFFINGAKQQPNCNESHTSPQFTKLDRNYLKEGDILPACSHKRSFKYYIESIGKFDCEFTGFKCSSYQDFIDGKCTECQSDEGEACAKFGSEQASVVKGNSNYYLNTWGWPPFCMNPYKVEINFDNASGSRTQQNGNFELIMVDGNGILATAYPSNHGSTSSFKTTASYSRIYYAKPPVVSKLVEVRLKWVHNSNALCLFCNTAVYVRKITIQFISMSKNRDCSENQMCAVNEMFEIKSGSYISFEKCNQITETPKAKPM